ncbi:peptidoglycan editing factor PgeF [Mammaliicoccus stepanovicii]|uniref:Purine nucleoside phosphorylase n=1 Tax=Mammaliicoccus stepanovicii TaxID=643214 RepID=A0A239ZLA7_9STAP|nr:peptidoglycan editing factor PgeF [Mammaliicoccus stepanovicii]PNZ77918.1 peptidoglycan editing factor PgeF [Mammaliicoccus stepanovicii]GGI41615.1 laccase domain protein [Mammaliicoccus stepanovicii]SNV71588.1 multi-copper polyphenol oxidoreductase laccase [Mammaliicoccus stepanovicii]
MKEIFNQHEHHLAYHADGREDLVIGITTRNGGFSPYPDKAFNMARYIDDNEENISKHQQILADEINFETTNWIFPIQTHENKVQEVNHKDKGTNITELTNELYGIDGLYTYESNILLTMCFADCVPIYLYDVKNEYVGLCHAGWRGTYAEIIKEMIEQYNGNLNDLRIIIGPSTSNSYEINEDIYQKFQTLPIDIDLYTEYRDKDRYGIDLKIANEQLAIYYGINPQHILRTKHCTANETDMFFSYRVEKGNTGRMLAFIGRK